MIGAAAIARVQITKQDLRELELRLKPRLSQIEQKITDAQMATVKWFAGMLLVQAIVIVALIKLLP